MSKLMIRISNSETGEVIDRPMTEEEIAEHEAITANVLAEAEQKTTQAEAKATLLDRLGITADEAKLLLS